MVDIQEWIEDESGRFKKIKKSENSKGKDDKWLELWIDKIDSEAAEKKKGEYFTGQLKITKELSKLSSLTCLGIDETLITGIDLNGCFHLIQLEVIKNPYLTSVDFLAQLPNPQKLIYLELSYGNFAETTLDFLEPFTNLKQIDLSVAHYTEDEWCGKTAEEWIKAGVYNKFRGSLKPLEKLLKLEKLHIENTDFNSGYEFLLEDQKKAERIDFSYCCEVRPEAECKKIAEKLEEQKESSERERGRLIEKQWKEWEEEKRTKQSKESETVNDINPEENREESQPPTSPYQQQNAPYSPNEQSCRNCLSLTKQREIIFKDLNQSWKKNFYLRRINSFLFLLIILLGAIAGYFYYKWKKKDKQKQY
jgi:hypothetical protein